MIRQFQNLVLIFFKEYIIYFICSVTYKEAARITEEKLEAKKGDKEVTFDCRALGFPPTNTSWEKNNSPIDGKRIKLEAM